MSPSADARDERHLVDVAKTGDHSALSEIYSLYFPRVYRYVLARTGNVNDAEDLTEEVFLKMLNAINRFEWRDAPFSAWIFRIAHNAIISQRRKVGSRGKSVPLSEALPIGTQGPEESVEQQLSIREVMRAAEDLPEAQRMVISLRFAAGLSIAETAEALGKSQGNVKVIQHKGIVKLREMLLSPEELDKRRKAKNIAKKKKD